MARTAGSFSGTTGPLVRRTAERLFARHGYAAVSMRQIAAEVGVQAGALYSYTPDKQSLLFDILRTHLEEVLDDWRAQPVPADPLEMLQGFTRHHLRFHFDRPDMMFIANMELRNLTPENFAMIEALRAAYESELGAILRAGQATGAFHIPDLRLATMGILAMLAGVTRWYREDGRLTPARIEEIYAQMVLRLAGSAMDLPAQGPAP